jgi:GTP-binding protein Era
MKSGFISLVGRPNVGKSTLLNALCGEKVSIVSDKPQTTRTRIRGVVNRPDAQLVFVDTPGLHKPVTALGERVNATALDATSDVDVTCLVLDATKVLGGGDRWVAARLDIATAVVIVNKIDRVKPEVLLERLNAASSLGAESYFPVSAKTGEGLGALVAHLVDRCEEGPAFFPEDQISDLPEETRVAELVREQLLALTRQELPYSIATRVTEWEWPRVRCEIVVERPAKKAWSSDEVANFSNRSARRFERNFPPEPFSSCTSRWIATGSTEPIASNVSVTERTQPVRVADNKFW